MPLFCLDHLSAGELTPPELVAAAAEAGYDAVSPWFQVPPYCAEAFPMTGASAMLRETATRCADTGVRVFNVGLFLLLPAGPLPDWEAMLEAGATLGAGRGIALCYDEEPERRLDTFAALAERARAHRIAIDIEFHAGSGWPSLDAALGFIRDAAIPETGLVLDALHLHRTGGSPADIDDEVRRLIRYAQLCDGPATIADEDAAHEAAFERQVPGEGALPLGEFVAALPADVPVGIEVPLQRRRDAGLAAVDRARLLLDAANRLFPDRHDRPAPRPGEP